MDDSRHFSKSTIECFPDHSGPDVSAHADGETISTDDTEARPESPGAVRFETDSDADASRISAVFEALGYQVTRVGMTDEDARIKYALGVIARRCHLTPREEEFARAMADHIIGVSGLAMHFGVSLQTATWVKRSISTKVGTVDICDMIDRIAEAAP